MRNFLLHTALVLTAAFAAVFPVAAPAQTLSLNDGAILQSKTNRVGLNIGAIDYWDQGQILKNLIGSSDPGLEPLQNRQIWALSAAGTSTTFTVPDVYDVVPANYWAGGTFTIVETQSGGAEMGCTGTIASNTGPNYPESSVVTWTAPQITVATSCAAPFAVGDIIVLSKVTFPTPESWWETGGNGGTAGSVQGGARLLSDTTDLCATCGVQALNMNATASGSVARVTWGFDSEYNDNVFILMNGTFQLSFWAKSVSGTPKLTASASRGSAGGFNCGTYTPTLSGAWTQYTWTCTASENPASVTPASALVSFALTGGSIYLDNVSFQKVNTNPSNPTILRDEVIEALQNYYGPAIGSNPGTLRYWVNQNGETVDNWTQPDYLHMPTGSGTGYFISPGGKGTETLSLEDYLVICQYLNAEPYLEVPVTLTNADAANLIEFLAGPASSTFGAKRAALGQSEPWTQVFNTIHLSPCDECWNFVFAGQNLPARQSGPDLELYYDYSVRVRDIFASMRADSNYSQSSFDLVMNAQTGTNSTMDQAIQRAHPDSIEIESYTMGPVSAFATDSELWTPAMIDPWEKVMNPKDIRNFYQSVHDYESQTTCGASGTATCNVNIYEWGQGTVNGGIDQQHLDYINAGAGEGVVMALQPLLNLQLYGIRPQSFFSLTEYKNSASVPNPAIPATSKLWGNTVDMGGATNNVRPTFQGVQVVNQSIIGPMYACPINNNLTYNFPGSPNGVSPMPAMNNVPYLYAFCFENGTKRSLVLINTDLSNSHSLSFGGINPPSGTVIQRQFAPSSLDDMNEAPTGSNSSLTQATTAIETSTLSSPASIVLPPFSVTALDYTSPGPQAAAMPSFSPAAGTYTTAQPVTIADTTAGTTIYYTTDGSTPTTSSKVYSGPVNVNATETLQAIAVETGYTNSPTAVAAYNIFPLLPSPTFSLAPGTFATTQTTSINEAAAGATIYYTTNGAAPTTSSSVYSGPLTITATETIQAIAVQTGYTNSPAGVALYTIAPALPAPTFSPAPGSFPNAMAVTISDVQPGALIYYTTNGTTPTASSTMYGGPIWLNGSQKFQAVAIQTGYTNSAPAAANYSVYTSLATPTISPAAGTYTSVQTVTISDATAGTTIYYTTNGQTPTTSSPVYSGPITVSASETVQAMASQTGHNNTGVVSATYTISALAPTPTFSVPSGTYTSTQSVAIADALGGATIYYTTNGQTPTTSSAVYSGPITVSSNQTVQAIAAQTGYANSTAATAVYTIAPVLPQPAFSVAPGTYTTNQTVAISDATAGTTIYYTTNGAAPTTSSSVYGGPITVSSNQTVQAIAAETGYTNSAVASAAYVIAPVIPTPMFSLAAGTYTTNQTVSILDAQAGATIYYTMDGSTPTTSSAVYGGPVTVSANATVQAIAVQTGYTNSLVASAAYVIAPVLPTPMFSLAAGTYTTNQTVSILDAQAGTTIYYTTNGAVPTTSSAVYSGPITVSSNQTIQAIAVANGYTNSLPASVSYTIAPVLPTPMFSLAAGVYTTSQTVAIGDAQAGTTIYYTTNGAVPTTSSAVYSGPITVNSNQTIQAIAVANGYTNSLPASAVYAIAPVLPTPTFSVAPGTFMISLTVGINDAAAGSAVYYTTDGSAPTTASNLYTGPVTMTSTSTLRAIAVAAGYTNSLAASATYTLSTVDPIYVNYPSNGFTASGLSLNYGASVSNGVLNLTDGGAGETRTAWAKTKVPVSAFTTDFTFQLENAQADGFTFTIQNDPKGIWAFGDGGGGLGYEGIQNSVAVKFDIYSDAGEGTDSTGVYTEGAAPTMPAADLTSSGVSLKSGDPIHAHIVYSGTTLTMTLTDTVTGASSTQQFTVNIPSAVGSTTAYIGFTATTGTKTATQQITSWTYVTP